ncbi:MAG TPA: PAS domain S-box protein, partial [Vicinamibacterales bacterium]|nr:PAS domain S-box protein [Vicinamibacterales bacterium]
MRVNPEEFGESVTATATSEAIEQALKDALDHAAEAIHWVAADGRILWANQTELDLLGYRRDEYVGRQIAEFHLDQPCIEDILTRLTRRETLNHYPARLRHKDGTVRHVQINSKVLWEGETFLRTQCFTRDVSAERVAGDAARRLAEIVENSDDATISHDLTGTIVSWNSAAERLYGYPRAEAVGQPIAMIIPPHLQHEETDSLARIKNGERVAPFDTVRRHKSGALLSIALTISPIRDADGRIIGASKTARDVTERKRIQARDRFLVALDDVVRPLSDPEEITYTAAKALGTHLGVNRCAYATVEDDQDTFTLTGNFNDGVQSIVGRYTFRQFGAECLRLMRAGEPYVVSDSATDPRLDEQDRASYVLTAITGVICVPVMKQGRFVAAMAVHTNAPRNWQPEEVALVQRVANRCWESIERAKVTQSLRESEARFRAVASTNSSLTLYEQDTDLRYTWVFPSHPEFASDNIGKTDLELLPRAEGEQLSQFKRDVMATGKGAKREITVTLPNDVRTYDLVIEPRHDVDGNIIGVGGVAVDVSERKKNEVLLARAQEAASESEARLREADRRKDEFLAMLAHELRNPLAPIRTGLQLMRLAGDTPQSIEQVRSMMERQLTHIVRLVDDLLDVSRITSGKIHLQREHVSLRDLIDGAIEVNRAAIESSGVTLDVHLPKEECTLFVDPTRTGQVISNVLNNAVKFSGAP